MAFADFMNKVRHWDTQASRWMMRHFYILFFEFIMIVIFFIFLTSTFHTIDIAQSSNKNNAIEQLLIQQNSSTNIIIVLMLLNSFWMLYLFSEVTRLKTILKDLSFYLSRKRPNN